MRWLLRCGAESSPHRTVSSETDRAARRVVGAHGARTVGDEVEYVRGKVERARTVDRVPSGSRAGERVRRVERVHGGSGAVSARAPRLVLRTLSKRFGALTALAPLSLELPPGSIHGVLGENGAGKSTLVRVLAGALRPDGGSVSIDGRSLPPGEPRAARAAGIGVVYQHFALIGALSVAENLLLGRPEAVGRLISPRRLATEAQALAHRHGLAIGDPTRPCVTLPVGTQARVEILRALSGGPKVLLLDEPTAVLTPPEIVELFETLRRLRAAGLLVMFITHKLDEALALCDTVSVLRGGRLVATVAAGGLSAARLAGMMVGTSTDAASPVAPPRAESLPGAPAALTASATPLPANETATSAGATATAEARPPAPAVLAVRNLTTAAEDGRVALQGIDFTLASCEICGIAGVDGNGQDELAAALYGLLDRQGTVTVAGTRLPPGDVAAAQRAGMALIPGDRRRDGLALGLAVWENVLLSAPLLGRFTRHGILDVASARRFAGELAREYRVTLTDVAQPIAGLSGGNQQRIVIGRALAIHPRVLIAVNPTRGLDIAATTQAHATLARAARAGAAVLLISTDLDELVALSTRLFALYRGRLAGPVDPDDRERLGALMTGLAA